MIMRTFLLLGLLLLGATSYFVVVKQPPTFQAVPARSEVGRLQREGVLPAGPFAENDEIEHGVFDVPAMDEQMLEAAMANMDMGGMDMGGMDMPDGQTMDKNGAPVLDMDMNGDGVMDMSNADMKSGEATPMADGAAKDMAGMDMPDGQTMDKDGAPVLDMDMNGDGVMDMSSADMKSGEAMPMADGAAKDMAGMDTPEGQTMDMADDEESDRIKAARAAGLMIREDGVFDREIKLSMMEWGFSDLAIDVKPGERIKFTLRNDGKILHEFMFMTMAAMQAVDYRAKRADWNLLEHEALFEKSLLLPGEEITFVATVIKPGAWMFMCMLPYHMQMGMMGQMATEGMAMQM